MKTLQEKRNRASSCSSYLRVLHKKREHATVQRPDQECQERHQVNSRSELFLFRRNSREGEIKTEGGKKSLIKFIQAFVYWPWAFINSDSVAMQIGVQVPESCLSPPCKPVEHHSPALGNVMPLLFLHFFFFFHALLKPFPHIPSPQKCTRTLMTRVTTWEGTGREGTADLPPLRGHKSHENIERGGEEQRKPGDTQVVKASYQKNKGFSNHISYPWK